MLLDVLGFDALPPAVHISGTVVDAAGTPLANIVVNAYDANGSITGTTTNASGQYQLALRSGTYRLVFEDPNGDYASVYYPNAESFGTSSLITAPATNINASMTHGGRITGTVSPASNAVVVAYNADGTVRGATIATSGQYSLLLPPGDYRVGAFDNSLTYAPQFFAQQALFAAATPLHVVSSATVPNINFALHTGGRFSGNVIDRGNGAPLAGITVGAYDAAGTLYSATQTKSDGTYRFVVEPGTYKLVAFDEAHRYATAYGGNAVSFDTAPLVSVASAQEIVANFAMLAAGTVNGMANDAASGSPIAGITVDAYDANGFRIASASTSSLGAFTLLLPSGTYKFVASDPQHRYAASFYDAAAGFDAARAVTVSAGQSVSIAFRLILDTVERRHRAVRH